MKYLFLLAVLFTIPALALAHAGEDEGVHHDMMGGGFDMMGGWGAVWSPLVAVTWFVWLVVGILLIMWLWQQIQKK